MQLTVPSPGELVLDSFRIQHQLGAGTFAIAYLAEQLGTDRSAVVKVPHPHLLEGPYGPEIRRRFEVEARAATRISHPNVVTVYTVGETQGHLPAIAMEYVNGQSLSNVLASNAPLALVQVAALGEQLGEALLALHEVGIVHRDLSPANVIVRERGAGLFAKLLDFGVAKLLDSPNRTLGPMGTPGYLAPEQLQGLVTPQTDVYSLGAILWWALTGHERPDDFADGTLFQSIGSPIGPDPLAVRPDAPPSLAEVVSRMLIPNYQLRPTVEEFLRLWREALDETAVPRQYPMSASSAFQTAGQTKRLSGIVRPRVAVVVGNAVLRNLISGYLATDGELDLVACTPRELMRANPGHHAAAVIDSDQSDVDVCALLPALSEFQPDLALIVIGSAERAGEPWSSFGAHYFVQLPEELARLRGDVSRALGRRVTTGPIHMSRLSTNVVEQLRIEGRLRATLDMFMGSMPQWLAELQIGLATGDLGRASVACKQLLATAESLGMRDLARLGRAACAFIEDRDLASATTFTAALEREYHELFPEIFSLLQSS